jgi:predicted RNA-binding Zn-ribbon protein involved in translation (DUF1610 family)
MIRMTCSGCGAKLKVSDGAVGKTMPCPKCGKVLTVSEPVYDAEAISEPTSPTYDPYPLDEPAPGSTAPVPAGEDRHPCPMCGEMILATAAKCRFCGEIFDPALKKAEALKSNRSGGPEEGNLTIGEVVCAVICSGIGCIMGIIWLIQGKPKGKKMFGLSLLFFVIGIVVQLILQNAKKP